MQETYKELFYYFESKKAKKVAKWLGNNFKTQSIPLTDLLNLVVELLKRDDIYFNENVYPRFYKALGRKVPYQQLVDIDRYILENYSLIQGERILNIISGNVTDKKTTTSGRIFLTNYRMIVCGTQQVRSAQKQFRTGGVSMVGMVVGASIRSSITRKRKNIRASINRALRGSLQDFDVLEWGYFFPVTGAYKIKPKKSSISYRVDIETEKKPEKLPIRVNPNRFRSQAKPEFRSERESFLNNLNNLLHEFAA
mgnify:CR=1 FL=1